MSNTTIDPRFYHILMRDIAEFTAGGVKYAISTAEEDRDNESPLEAMFAAALSLYVAEVFGNYDPARPIWQRQVWVIANARRYRLDFACVQDGAKLAVELDGHTHHERTPQQVAYRNTRDADLMAAGWSTVHFSWHQVFDTPFKCAEAAVAAAYNARAEAFTLQRLQDNVLGQSGVL
jgi:very-short-patch-repair endonuclease